MGLETLINQGKVVFESIKNLDKDALFTKPNLQPWNGLDFDDFIASYQNMVNELDKIYENDVLVSSAFNIVNGMNSQLNAVLQHCNQFITQKAQAHYQNAFQHIESMRSNIQTWGLRYEAVLGKEIEERSKLIDDEIAKLLSNRNEIISLKENVAKLIEPAVAGSLSKSFSDRKDALHNNQNRWFWASVVTAIVSVLATIAIVWSIVGVFSNEIVLKALENGKDGVSGVVWSTIFLRIGALLPIYSIFVFTFLQYKKERDLEEEYAHKAAVATSLPNYGGLAVDDRVKDQILSEASKVIFVSPTSNLPSKDSEKPGDINQLNKLLSNIQRLIPKSE